MAKVVQQAYAVSVSRLVKDGTDEDSVFPNELVDAIEAMVAELISDPAVIIEVTEIKD